VVQDRALLDKASAAWAPLERLGKAMKVHGEQMKRHGEVMKSLGGDMTLGQARPLPPKSCSAIGEQYTGIAAFAVTVRLQNFVTFSHGNNCCCNTLTVRFALILG
jgi:hypothetical protein